MKYNPKNRMLEFANDAEVSEFHDQLTLLMRAAMNGIGDAEITEDEGAKFTLEFFARYAALTDTLSCLRAHLPRKVSG